MKKTNDKSYLQNSKTLFTANKATIKSTGEVFDLTPELKMAYFWMRDQYVFSLSNGNKYFASWEAIFIESCGLGYDRKAKKAVKTLIDIGLVVIEGSRKSNHKVVKDVTEVDVVFSNDLMQDFKDTREERVKEKKERFTKWKAKQQAKPQFEVEEDNPASFVATPVKKDDPFKPYEEKQSIIDDELPDDFDIPL